MGKMIITFKSIDGSTYQFDIVEDYGNFVLFNLWDKVNQNPKLGKIVKRDEK